MLNVKVSKLREKVLHQHRVQHHSWKIMEKAIRKQSAQYDLFNRLHSIAADEAFVRRIAEEYNGRFQVVGESLM